MSTATLKPAPGAPKSAIVTDGSRISARWRILGWLLLATAVGLLAVVITVNSAMQASVGRQANDDILQELDEFEQFTAEGVNPETAQPFSAVEPLIDVFLRRQRPGMGELALGMVDGKVIDRISGAQVPTPSEYDLTGDDDAMKAFAEDASGVLDTPAGELRWAKTTVTTNSGEQGVLIVGIYTEPAYSAVADTTKLIITVSIGALLLTAALGWVIAGQILRPIRTMRRTAAKISEHDLTRRIPVHGRDDLADLATTFNDVLERLESAFVTEQRFVDEAGHWLRSPMTTVRQHLDRLRSNDIGPAERSESLAIASYELDRMSRVVTDLLALVQSERPGFVQIQPDVEVSRLTHAIAAHARNIAPRSWTITDVAAGTAPLDPTRIEQAMLQLAHNAAQHTKVGDQIRLASSFIVDTDGAPALRLSVTDSGPGLTATEASTIFERFGRGGHRMAGNRSGAGLGLAIVRAIADAHGGSAYVESVPGLGATFGLILPCELPEEATIIDEEPTLLLDEEVAR